MMNALGPWIEGLLDRMTLAEKIGQMTQVAIQAIGPEDVEQYGIGSVLSGGGGNPDRNDPAEWAGMVRRVVQASARTRLGIPLIYGVDAIHGHSNVRGAVIFPHNIGLGAAGDPALVERIASITAREVAATGAHWVFAPVVAVAQDLRWGRFYESYGIDPETVAELAAAHVRGLQGAPGSGALADQRHVLACPKHFVGDGGAVWGSAQRYDWVHWWDAWPDTWQVDQGTTAGDEATLRSVHLPPYQRAIEAGALSIMVSYTTWNGLKMHANQYLLTDVLKGELGFDGFLVSDWMAIDQIDPDYEVCVETAIKAGIDMVMVPIDFRRFIETTTRLVEAGRIGRERIDDAVRRILGAKAALGLFDDVGDGSALLSDVGSAAHRAVAREAVAKSTVLLKNDGVLPVPEGIDRILVAGPGADDIGLQCGGWTIEWQGGIGSITPGTTLLEALRNRLHGSVTVVHDPDGTSAEEAPLGLVVIAEPPYAEGLGDTARPVLSAEDLATFRSVRSRCARVVVVLYTGRPLVMPEVFDEADAVVCAWLPGSEGDGLADVLLGEAPFLATLSTPWPQTLEQVANGQGSAGPDWQFPLGAGIVTGRPAPAAAD